MSAPQASHQFAAAGISQISNLREEDCKLAVRQQPMIARVAVGKEKDRKPVDPPPIIQLQIPTSVDPQQGYLQSPYFFLSCSLVSENSEQYLPAGTLGTSLAGTLVSSLHRLKDTSNSDGAFFVFGDLSVKVEGTYKLQFTLYQMQDDEVFHITSTLSDPFPVHSAKNFPGMAESTFLTRTFSDQGVRLRLRKEPRTLLRKRGPADDNYQPRTYNKAANRNSNNEGERQPVTSPDSQDSISHAQNEQQIEAIPAHANNFEHRPTLPRHFPDQSAPSYTPGTSYDEPAKRPRTGSEQGQTSPYLHQGQTMESPHYSDRSYSDPHTSYNTFNPQLPHVQGYNYASTGYSSPSSGGSRDQQYFGTPRIQSQLTSISPFEPQRSPSATYFPQNYTPSIQQGTYSPQVLPSAVGQRSQHGISDLGLARIQIPSPSSMQGPMAPPLSTRMPFTLNSTLSVRRDTYPVYQEQIPSMTSTYPVRPGPPNHSESPVEGFQCIPGST